MKCVFAFLQHLKKPLRPKSMHPSRQRRPFWCVFANLKLIGCFATVNKVNKAVRVTRLGKLLPIRRLFTLGSFREIRSSLIILATFSTVKIMHTF
jgi:hypothetical protein